MSARRTAVARMAAVAVLAGAIGCGGSAPLPVGNVRMTLGSVDASGSFAPLGDGQDVTLVEGAQGGFHVWMKFRIHGMSPLHVNVEKTAHRASDGQIVLRSMGAVDIGEPDANGDWELPMAVPMFMCPSPVGIRIIDERITFSIALSDDAGQPIATQSITLVPHCPDAQTKFCTQICSG